MDKRLFWIDFETTGLEDDCKLLEVACVITDLDFNELAHYESVIFQPPEVLAGMNPWCVKQHGETGLTELVPTGKPQDVVEQELIAFAQANMDVPEKIVLHGNTVNYDRDRVKYNMPNFLKLLHYRVMDVSSVKEFFWEKWKFEVKKNGNHRALVDIRESVKEMQTYASYIKYPAA